MAKYSGYNGSISVQVGWENLRALVQKWDLTYHTKSIETPYQHTNDDPATPRIFGRLDIKARIVFLLDNTVTTEELTPGQTLTNLDLELESGSFIRIAEAQLINFIISSPLDGPVTATIDVAMNKESITSGDDGGWDIPA